MADSVEQLELFPRSDCPLDYSIRESSRARHVSIKVSLQGHIEVVVPKGFDSTRVPEILYTRQDWIRKTRHCLQSQTDALAPEHFEMRPTTLELRSHSKTWQVLYCPQPKRPPNPDPKGGY